MKSASCRPFCLLLPRIVACCMALCAAGSQAGGGPENVFLVVNARGEKSKEAANHYIQLRRVPPSNVFYATLPPNANVISGADFRDKLLAPVLQAIEDRGLSGQIDHVVYSCEFPWKIDFTALVPPAQATAQLRPVASLTGATYFYMFVEQNDASFMQLHSNLYFAPTVNGATASRAFRRAYGWGPGGARVEAGGLQYLLSTQLGSTSPSGNTTQEIVAYLKRAAEADGTRPRGTFFYMRNGNDPRSTPRHDAFAAAADELRGMGLAAQVVNGVVPSGQRDVAGLTTGSAQVPLRASGSVLLPGALVDNLTSQGAVLTRLGPAAQTRVSEFLRLGAAGASGAVVEPFNFPQKFPSPALHVHYARGLTMAEAFYQSIAGPYQMLIVGDPLCQPWAAIPEVTVGGVADGDIVSGTVELTPAATMSGAAAVDHFELYVDGRRRDAQRPGVTFSLDTTKLPDGYHELRVVAVDDSPLEVQGRWIGGVTVKNGREALSVTAPGARVVGAQLTLTVTSTVDGETAVVHNGRELGRVSGRRGTLQVATAQLGKGPTAIQARRLGTPALVSPPLVLTIE